MGEMALGGVIGLILGLLATGVFAGVLAGLLGVGGGIVVVPVLFQVFALLDIDPAVRMHLAVGTSLAIIVPTSLRSARAHYRAGTVDTGLLRDLGVSLVVGVLLGVVLSAVVSGAVLTAVFGVMAMLVAANMARRGGPPRVTVEPPRGAVRHGIGAFIGSVSTMMGIGGGTLSVPILDALGYPIRRSIGTAAAIGTVISVPGTVGFVWAGWGAEALPPLSFGYVSLLGVAVIAPLTVACAPIGVKLAMRMDTTHLKRAFAIFLFATAVTMLYSVVSG
ncbi:sulfite exporter TauE/SafE family protein [Aquisalimonas asiatica]|uniref:Probable membrane transporter protein n=1 Tax=Aquisalimonas asiatica TaxID=406100 RepID=A0A1H8TZH7_9GAMM|nr:sulfite exporter TauE/SafE family protein [Aquisalimonas asiatica]SEO95933.1 Uncharacterized membrane protein YfcA [Aquisalimonas asiatica]